MQTIRLLVISNYHKIVPSRPEAEAMINLYKQGVALEIITVKDAQYTPIFREAGITVHERHPVKKRDVSARKFIRERLVEGKFNILHLFNSKAILNGIPASRGLSVKILLYRGTASNIYWYDPTLYLKYFHPRVDGIWCIAQAVEDLFHQQLFFRKETTKVIHKGHHPDWYDPIISKPLEPIIKERLNSPAPFNLIIVANARRVKGIDYLYKMTHLLPKELPIHLYVVGRDMDTEDLNKIRMASPNVDRIHLLGYRKDAISLVKTADVFVLSSLFGESTTKAVIEAMFVGTMPLVTNLPGNRELVIDKKNGRVVPIADPQAMAKVILELYHDRTQVKNLSEKASAFVRTEFHSDKTALELRNWYTDLLN